MDALGVLERLFPPRRARDSRRGYESIRSTQSLFRGLASVPVPPRWTRNSILAVVPERLRVDVARVVVVAWALVDRAHERARDEREESVSTVGHGAQDRREHADGSLGFASCGAEVLGSACAPRGPRRLERRIVEVH
jgi:hypothetical protein